MSPGEREISDRAARVRLATGTLFRRIRSEARGTTGLTLFQESIVSLLVDAADGMSISRLADAEGVRAQTMSTAVFGLQKGGYVRIDPDPDDRRRKILHATDEGRRALARSSDAKHRWLGQVLKTFTADDLHQLDQALDMLERLANS